MATLRRRSSAQGDRAAAGHRHGPTHPGPLHAVLDEVFAGAFNGTAGGWATLEPGIRHIAYDLHCAGNSRRPGAVSCAWHRITCAWSGEHRVRFRGCLRDERLQKAQPYVPRGVCIAETVPVAFVGFMAGGAGRIVVRRQDRRQIQSSRGFWCSFRARTRILRPDLSSSSDRETT